MIYLDEVRDWSIGTENCLDYQVTNFLLLVRRDTQHVFHVIIEHVTGGQVSSVVTIKVKVTFFDDTRENLRIDRTLVFTS